ncbi:putative membrane protein YphA (DoxX/SURF4 family) [Paenibacillus rhizosphaerae]|uniref:Putative membrane protein YphA (DoxX/SURF4 family) n=1 Tax=Paenibacillus rhizosphaerae TaxID=297318 RepID=A0A839TZN2_9BACL|nr:DoxX family protein [Paenibacillus rhizosphaerae]MBB3130107.1 putative membrane protein YphA (DoxX/SURF4 family) [Paenibacillus rhizosphaerae]
MHILSIILQDILGLGFLMFGFMKFGSKQMVEVYKHYGYPGWFRFFTGFIEVISRFWLLRGFGIKHWLPGVV